MKVTDILDSIPDSEIYYLMQREYFIEFIDMTLFRSELREMLMECSRQRENIALVAEIYQNFAIKKIRHWTGSNGLRFMSQLMIHMFRKYPDCKLELWGIYEEAAMMHNIMHRDGPGQIIDFISEKSELRVCRDLLLWSKEINAEYVHSICLDTNTTDLQKIKSLYDIKSRNESFSHIQSPIKTQVELEIDRQIALLSSKARILRELELNTLERNDDSILSGKYCLYCNFKNECENKATCAEDSQIKYYKDKYDTIIARYSSTLIQADIINEKHRPCRNIHEIIFCINGASNITPPSLFTVIHQLAIKQNLLCAESHIGWTYLCWRFSVNNYSPSQRDTIKRKLNQGKYDSEIEKLRFILGIKKDRSSSRFQP